MEPTYWANQKQSYQDAITYIHQRFSNTVTSFRTPWPKMNEAGVDGLEWHTMTVIAARPKTGKTVIKDQIVREITKHNPGQNINVLEFQLEMVAKASKVREFCSVLGKPYKYICSASKEPTERITETEIRELLKYSKTAISVDKCPVDIVEKPCTVEMFVKIISLYMEQHSQVINNKRLYTNTVVTLDHSCLLLKSKQHKNKTDMLYDLGEAVTGLKRKYPIAFIILSQLGRDAENAERNENGKYGNYVLDNDLFGGDALFQHADMVIGVNRPALRCIEYYGPERFIISDDAILVWHFLKCRSGDTRISFFRAEFDKMEVSEMDTPAQQKKLSFNVD